MGLGDFVKRHKNKLFFAAGAAGTILVIKKIFATYEKQWESSSSRGFVYEVRKKEIHFENIINECNQLCQRMAPQVIDRLQELLDETQLIEALASERGGRVQKKVEIWKSLKVKILTKLLGEVYCSCILVCYMRVQMSVVGGQLFAKYVSADTKGSSSASAAELTHMKAYTKYRALLASFFDQRFDTLIQPIEEAVEEALVGYSLDHNICIQDFKVILDKIKRTVSFLISGPSSKTKVFFLDADQLSTADLSSICPGSGSLSESDETMLRSMLAETQDILESEDFKHVLESSIEVGYALLLDFLLGAFIKMESKLDMREGNPGFSNPNSIQVPLVKLLPQIRNNYSSRSESEQKALVNHLLSLDVLNCFAANVYEAFCVPK